MFKLCMLENSDAIWVLWDRTDPVKPIYRGKYSTFDKCMAMAQAHAMAEEEGIEVDIVRADPRGRREFAMFNQKGWFMSSSITWFEHMDTKEIISDEAFNEREREGTNMEGWVEI